MFVSQESLHRLSVLSFSHIAIDEFHLVKHGLTSSRRAHLADTTRALLADTASGDGVLPAYQFPWKDYNTSKTKMSKDRLFMKTAMAMTTMTMTTLMLCPGNRQTSYSKTGNEPVIQLLPELRTLASINRATLRSPLSRPFSQRPKVKVQCLRQ